MLKHGIALAEIAACAVARQQSKANGNLHCFFSTSSPPPPLGLPLYKPSDPPILFEMDDLITHFGGLSSNQSGFNLLAASPVPSSASFTTSVNGYVESQTTPLMSHNIFSATVHTRAEMNDDGTTVSNGIGLEFNAAADEHSDSDSDSQTPYIHHFKQERSASSDMSATPKPQHQVNGDVTYGDRSGRSSSSVQDISQVLLKWHQQDGLRDQFFKVSGPSDSNVMF